MRTYTRFTRLTGFMLLAIVFIILLTPPNTIFSQDVSFIYPSLDNPKADQISVKTKMDFGDQQHVESFPYEIEHWTARDRDPEDVQETRKQLGADVLVERYYYKPGLWKGLTFMIIAMGIAETVGLFGFVFLLLVLP